MVDRSIVVSKLGDMDGVFGYPVDEAVFVIDSTRPVARKRMLERLRLSNTFKRVAFGRFKEFIDTLENLFVGFLPEKIVVPSVI